MVFADWTFTNINGISSCALDASEKYTGTSSAKFSIGNYVTTPRARLTHDTFSEPHVQLIGWVRTNIGQYGSIPTGNVRHSSYGTLSTTTYKTNETWERFRFTFWYDISANTRWGRLEKYVTSEWVQQGADTNFGSGSPSAGTIALEGTGLLARTIQAVWFDEVEVYS